MDAYIYKNYLGVCMLEIIKEKDAIRIQRHKDVPNSDWKEYLSKLKCTNWDTLFLEGLESYLCNGWDRILPEEVGALTDGILLSDDAVFDDSGELIECKSLYHNPYYMTQLELKEINRKGYVKFILHKED